MAKHTVRRSHIYEDVIKLYSTDLACILDEFPFRTSFEGERAVDVGGVTRDLFSAFFEEAYVKHFDGASLLVPVDIPNTYSPPFSALGAIFSHAYMVAGMLPVKIAFPTLASILLPNLKDLPNQLMLEAFLDSLSPHDACICREALKVVKQAESTFVSAVQMGLITILSRYSVCETPKPAMLLNILISVANHYFLQKPAYFISEMKSAIPDLHRPFWDKLTCEEIHSIYRAQQVSASKVLAMLDDPQTSNLNEERVYGYLQQFIGSLREDELRSFLRFTTGSAVSSSVHISVCFNSLEGLARRPTSHTCSSCLELPSSYCSYGDFKQEFLAILQCDDVAWQMDAI